MEILIIKFKTVRKCLDANPCLALQNIVVLPIVPWEQMEFLTNVSEIMKISGPTKSRTPTNCLRNFCPNLTAEIYFWIKIVAKGTLKKQLYWLNNFSRILENMWRKIMTFILNFLERPIWKRDRTNLFVTTAKLLQNSITRGFRTRSSSSRTEKQWNQNWNYQLTT